MGGGGILGVMLPCTIRLGLCRSMGMSERGDTECGDVREEGTARAPRVHSGTEDLLLSPRAECRSKATGKCGFKETLAGVS